MIKPTLEIRAHAEHRAGDADLATLVVRCQRKRLAMPLRRAARSEYLAAYKNQST